jgi:hypothetical protein
MFVLYNGYLINTTKISYLSDIQEIVDEFNDVSYGFEIGVGGEGLPLIFRSREKCQEAYDYLFKRITQDGKMIDKIINEEG